MDRDRRRRLAAVCVALVVASAGCSSLDPAGTPTRDTFGVPPTSQTQPTLADDVGTNDRVVAPGVTGTGISDPSPLLAAHAGRLRGSSFRFERDRVVMTVEGDRLSRSEVEFYRDPGGGFFLESERRSGTDIGQIEYWSRIDGTDGTDRTDGNNGTSGTYRWVGGTDCTVGDLGRVRGDPDLGAVLGTDPTYRPILDRYLSLMGDGEVRPVGEDRYWILSQDLRDPDRLGLGRSVAGRVENVSMVVVVTEEGVITSLLLSYILRREGEDLSVSDWIRIENVGRTSVPTPAWHDEAIAAADATTGTPTESAPPRKRTADAEPEPESGLAPGLLDVDGIPPTCPGAGVDSGAGGG